MRRVWQLVCLCGRCFGHPPIPRSLLLGSALGCCSALHWRMGLHWAAAPLQWLLSQVCYLRGTHGWLCCMHPSPEGLNKIRGSIFRDFYFDFLIFLTNLDSILMNVLFICLLLCWFVGLLLCRFYGFLVVSWSAVWPQSPRHDGGEAAGNLISIYIHTYIY